MTDWSNTALLSIPTVLREQVVRTPAKTALVLNGESISYQALLERSVAAARGLQELGVGFGDSVGVLSPNTPEMIYTWIGASMLGAVYVPVNVEYKGTFLIHQWTTAAVGVAVVDSSCIPEVAAVATRLPDLKHVVVVNRGTDRVDLGRADLQVHDSAELMTPARFDGDLTAVPGVADPPGDAIAAVIFTAGTTGPSKGVAMSHNYMVRSARQVFDLRGCTQDSVVYGALPLFHLAAISVVVLGPILAGATAVLDARFSPNNFWSRVRETGADQTILLGAMSTMLWNRPEDPGDADNPLKVALIAPMPPALHRQFEQRFGLTVLQMYAQSEVYPLTVASAHDPAPPGYSGRPNPLLTVRLFDENDNEVPPGQVGEVCVRPNQPHVMFEGYFKNPEATAATWRNLWMHTGDLGRFNEEGFFEFVDRKKDYLRRRGENISSFEVEHAVMQFEGVAEVAVVAAPSELTEDDVIACVVPVPGVSIDPVALMDHCVAEIPYFAIPRYLWILDELPRNPVGRVEKYKLRERFALRQGVDGLWDREAAGFVIERRTFTPAKVGGGS
ncbi:ATP-dependent acyl-CoA ligase [Sporichthya brevicatena]|uniref:ATP-dependent acyl-CoA ligase n=1 Tax=Sporichthya brevicatena TaxID=171442 RepID=A0ABN1GNN0_9ACTN